VMSQIDSQVPIHFDSSMLYIIYTMIQTQIFFVLIKDIKLYIIERDIIP